jgi:hypothetical protein
MIEILQQWETPLSVLLFYQSEVAPVDIPPSTGKVCPVT